MVPSLVVKLTSLHIDTSTNTSTYTCPHTHTNTHTHTITHTHTHTRGHGVLVPSLVVKLTSWRFGSSAVPFRCGVLVVSQWYYGGVTVVLHQCYNATAVCKCVAVVSQLCYSDVVVV
jgi:hypothetical protein